MRKLGRIQKGVLNSLSIHGDWHPTKICGWTWDNDSHTKQVLNSLHKRGLVIIDKEGWYKLPQKENYT